MRATGPVAAPIAHGDGGLVSDLRRFAHEAMATVFEVRCVHPDARYAAQAAQAAFHLVDRLEQLLSRFIGNSDVSRLNQLAAGQVARVHEWTMECLEVAWHAYELTGGAFDVALGSGLERLELLPEEMSIRAREAGARLDLGGIGKGYAVDLAAELLLEWGIPSALVHGGWSSVLALSAPPGREAWPLTFSRPGSGGPVLARVSATRRAFSASGLRKGEHILDPRSGRTAGGRLGAWVVVPWAEGERAAAVADALSTAFMIQPLAEIQGLCRAGSGLEAWLLPAGGDRAGEEEGGGSGEAGRLVHLDGSA